MKKSVLIVLTISICASMLTQVFAKSLNDLKNQQQQADQKTRSAQSRLNQTKQSENDTLNQIDRLDTALDKVTDSLDNIDIQLRDTQTLLIKTQTELYDATAAKQTEVNAFKLRARFLYVHGKLGYLDIMLKSASISDLLNRIIYIKHIVAYDNDLVSRLKATELTVQTKYAQVNDQQARIKDLRAEQEANQASLQQQIEEKNALLDSLDADAALYAQEVADNEAASRQIAELIKKREAELAAEAAEEARRNQTARNAVPYSGGKVSWPLPGNTSVSSDYGNRLNPINHSPEFHTGIDIPAPTGTGIHAAEGGVVIAAGYNVIRGYGYSILIDHGNGLSTFYGHCSRLFVRDGDSVKKGDIIGNVGSTGYATGPHLHFEVRVSGGAQNPISYLSGR